MAIELTWFPPGPLATRGQYQYFQESVVHIGNAPPDEKPNSITIGGSDVADHHAKLFWGQGRYWLVNLCGLPCMLLKASGRAVPLTILEPTAEIAEGDGFQIGETAFHVDKLQPPENRETAPRLDADAGLAADLRGREQAVTLPQGNAPEHPVAWQTLLRLSASLCKYTRAHEMWRCSVDRMAVGFRRLWRQRPPALLVLAAAICTDRTSQPLVIFRREIPQDPSLSGEHREFQALTGLPESLPATVASIVLDQAEAQRFHWTWPGAPRDTHLVAGRVLRGAAPAGAVMLVTQWDEEQADALDADAAYVFLHSLRSLGLSLTFLDERKKALAFERLHDLGSVARSFTHDECHIIELAERELGAMETFLANACSNCVHGSQPLSAPLRKVRMIARQVRGIARAALRFAREHERLAAGDGLEVAGEWLRLDDCAPAVQEWIEQTIELNNDGKIHVYHEWDLGDAPLIADRDELLAALRNLYLNSMRSVGKVQTLRAVYQVRFRVRQQWLEGPAEGEESLPYVVAAVADNGAGMTPGVAARVFRGRVLDSASGYGLGTQIVRWVMDQHRGLIRFVTKSDRATVVELWFPKLSSAAPSQEEWRRYEAARRSLSEVATLPSHELIELMDRQTEP